MKIQVKTILWTMIIPFQAALAVDFGKLPPENVAYIVQNAQTGAILQEHNADVPMNPASVMKLVTSYTALGTLGAHYRWQSAWTARAPIKNGILQGNLFWRGAGDPSLDQKDIIAMQEQLKQQGIHTISGNLVLDRSIWQGESQAPGFEDDEDEVFAVPPDPHMLSYKVVWMDAYQQANGKMNVRFNPPLINTPVSIHINTIKKRKKCTNLARTLHPRWDGHQLKISGQLPTSCKGQKMYINMLDAQQFAKESFIGQWHKLGGKGPNRMRVGKEPSDVHILASHYSKPLSEIVHDMNKFSNNLIARTLFLNLAENKTGNTAQAAQAVVYRYLKQNKIPTQSLIIENGSGLSRSERISARSMATLLKQAYHAPFSHEFIDSLPIAGTDGTLKRRLHDYPDLHLKTGTLKNVRALAGFRLPENPQQPPLIIVVFINDPQAKSMLLDFDNLVRSLLKPITAD